MSGGGNPNHDPSTGEFSSGGGSSGPKPKGPGQTPRKVRTAKRSTRPTVSGKPLDKKPLPPKLGGVHGTMDDAATAKLMSQPPIRGDQFHRDAAQGNKTFVMPHPDGSGDLIRVKAANVQDASKLHAAHLGDRTTANKLSGKEIVTVPHTAAGKPQKARAARTARRAEVAAHNEKSQAKAKADAAKPATTGHLSQAQGVFPKVDAARAQRDAASGKKPVGTGRDRRLAAQASAHSAATAKPDSGRGAGGKGVGVNKPAGGPGVGHGSAKGAAATAAAEKIMKGIDMPTEVRNSDRLDFHEQHVTTIRDSLISAYQAGGGGKHAPIHGEGALAKIAKDQLGIDSFAVKNSDREDFQEVGVAGMKKALAAAYDVGAADKGDGLGRTGQISGGRAARTAARSPMPTLHQQQDAMLKFAGTKNTEQAPKEVHRAEVAKTNDALAKAEKTMREHARSYGYKNVDGLKVSVTDKGAVLYDPDTNHVIVSMREEGGKPDFTGPTTRRK